MQKVYLPETISCGRVVLKRDALIFAKRLFTLVNKNRERLVNYLNWVDQIKSEDDEKKYLQESIDNWNEYKQFDYTIFTSDTDKLVGKFGVVSINWTFSSCELGYWIDKRWEGDGFIREILKKMEKILFDLGIYRIELKVRHDNVRSINVATSMSYVKDALLRENALHQGKRVSYLIYSKLKSDLPSVAKKKRRKKEVSAKKEGTLIKSLKKIVIPKIK